MNFISFYNKYLKLESPSPKDALDQVWLKLAHWYLPYEGCVAFHLDKHEFPLSNKYLFQLLKICSVILEKTTTTTMKRDNRLISIRKTHLSLQLKKQLYSTFI